MTAKIGSEDPVVVNMEKFSMCACAVCRTKYGNSRYKSPLNSQFRLECSIIVKYGNNKSTTEKSMILKGGSAPSGKLGIEILVEKAFILSIVSIINFF